MRDHVIGRFAFLAVAFLILAASVTHAQSVTGTLFGTVFDTSGAGLPGATVTVTSPQLITTKEARLSSDQGLYRFPALPPGTYELTFELTGFQTQKREGIVLLAGQSLAVDAKLELARVNETVTVVGEPPLIDTRSSALTNTADATTLETLPIYRHFTDILNIMPGVTDGLYDVFRVNTVHGSTTRQNLYNLDGVNVDDPNTNTTMTDLSPDAFQEVQVTTAGIAAEFGDASGGVFNYITRSGSNRFSGALAHHFQTEGLESDNVSDALRLQRVTGAGLAHLYDSSALLGGPIARNRAWFFANLRNVDQSERRADFSAPLDTTDWQMFTKGTVQATGANRVEASLFVRDHLNFPYTFASTFRNTDDPRTWSANNKRDYIISGSWTGAFSSRTVLESRMSIALTDQMFTSPNNVGAPVYIDMQTELISGGDNALGAVNERDRYQFKADLNHFVDRWRGGTHNFKVGFDWQSGPVRAEQFPLGARGAGQLEGCPNGNQCISQTPDTHHLLLNNAPFRVRLFNTPVVLQSRLGHWALYGQDQWVLRNRVTVNLGVRAEHYAGGNLESQLGGGRWEPQVTTFPDQTDQIDLTTVSPRVGFVWDVTGDHKSIVKGSYGRFYYQLNTGHTILANPARPGFREFDWIDRNGDRTYQPGEEGQLRVNMIPTLATLPTIDPDLKNQFSDVFSVGFERALVGRWTASIAGIFKRERDLLGTVNAAVPFSAFNPVTVVNPIDGQPLTIYTLRLEFQGRPPQNILTNPGERPGDPERLERNYNGLELVLRRRLDGRFQFETSYVYGKGEGNAGNATAESNVVPYLNPNFFVNRYGPLPLGPRHQFKLHGVYLAPYDFLVSAYFQALSGISWTDVLAGSPAVKGAATVRFSRTQYPLIQSENFIDVAAEPSGTRSFETQSRFDLRIEKRLPTRFGDLSIAADAFNLFNAGTVIRVKELRLDQTNFGIPGQLQLPRQLRLSVRWNFPTRPLGNRPPTGTGTRVPGRRGN